MQDDGELIQIVDAALAEAVRKSGRWLVCRPGCAECCIGPFPISRRDALRLRRGLEDLELREPERATRVRDRARQYVERFSADPAAILEGEAADQQPCPALDPDALTCDLYSARPLTCRTFGPPLRGSSEAIGVCELCFDGASEDEIAACEVPLDLDRFDDGQGPSTVVALALVE